MHFDAKQFTADVFKWQCQQKHTSEVMADLIGIPASTYNRLVGLRSVSKIEIVAKMAVVCGLSLDSYLVK